MKKNCNTVSFVVDANKNICTHARIRRAVIMNEITVNDQALSHRLLMDDKHFRIGNTYSLLTMTFPSINA